MACMQVQATSLSDLWARRWNLTVSALLRDLVSRHHPWHARCSKRSALVYQPVVEGRVYPQNGKPEAAKPQDPQQTQRHDSASSLEEEKGGSCKGAGKQDCREQPRDAGQGSRSVRPSRARKRCMWAEARLTCMLVMCPCCRVHQIKLLGGLNEWVCSSSKLILCARWMLGSTATFLFSGVWHELVFAQ
eukprot:scaffold144026_cov17-Tisochrysis_lutea.AAC.1